MTLQDIWRKRNDFCIESYGKYPDYFMIHPCNRGSIIDDMIKQTGGYLPNGIESISIFGIKVIWTVDVGEKEIICTSKSPS